MKKRLFELEEEAVIHLDGDGMISNVDKTAEAVLGFQSDQIRGTPITAILQKESPGRLDTMIKMVMAGTNINNIVVKKGEERSLKIQLHPLEKEGRITGTIIRILPEKENGNGNGIKKRSFEEIRARILFSLIKSQMTINQLANYSGINWKTVESHLVFLTGKGFVQEIFKSEYVRIFSITESGKEHVAKTKKNITKKYMTIVEDFPHLKEVILQ